MAICKYWEIVVTPPEPEKVDFEPLKENVHNITQPRRIDLISTISKQEYSRRLKASESLAGFG